MTENHENDKNLREVERDLQEGKNNQSAAEVFYLFFICQIKLAIGLNLGERAIAKVTFSAQFIV